MPPLRTRHENSIFTSSFFTRRGQIKNHNNLAFPPPSATLPA
ncbi:hypothetical protein HMPREF3038_02876 [Akkermansia sp. KLE1797]|nr:hypothetical protein HMPREF3038_02876 [Akkermansia sp. KLE1797]